MFYRPHPQSDTHTATCNDHFGVSAIFGRELGGQEVTERKTQSKLSKQKHLSFQNKIQQLTNLIIFVLVHFVSV